MLSAALIYTQGCVVPRLSKNSFFFFFFQFKTRSWCQVKAGFIHTAVWSWASADSTIFIVKLLVIVKLLCHYLSSDGKSRMSVMKECFQCSVLWFATLNFHPRLPFLDNFFTPQCLLLYLFILGRVGVQSQSHALLIPEKYRITHTHTHSTGQMLQFSSPKPLRYL